MPKFPQNAIVKHVSGDIRGYVMMAILHLIRRKSFNGPQQNIQ